MSATTDLSEIPDYDRWMKPVIRGYGSAVRKRQISDALAA